MSILEIARWYVSQGISVIPVRADGSKAPILGGWRAYSDKIADDAQLVEWFGGDGKLLGIGAVPGPASGNLVVLDFECKGESAYVEWLKRLPDDLRQRVEAMPTVATPSGGRHIWCRLAEPQHKGILARYANQKIKIEIRGEGHQVLAPGCPAECHTEGKNGKLYEWAIDAPFSEVAEDDWLSMVEHAAACNEFQAAEQPRDRDAGTPAGEDSPGNDFNRRGTWAEAGLFDAGWTWAKKTGDDRGFLTRPGKESGVSASVGQVSSKERGYPYLYCWTTSTEFAPETPFSRFAVYAMLKHSGNYGEAAKALARAGYGERPGMSSKPGGVDLSEFTMRLNTPDGKPLNPFTRPIAATPDTAEVKPFKWMSELSATADDAKWLWKGYIPRGGITLFSAIWKAGKSTLLSHLVKAFDGSVSQFLGLDVTPSRVLYVAEEDERIWAGRRDALMIGDHVGMWCRPFKMRPTMQEWREHLAAVGEQVAKHQFDLVVYDTLSKMWPVREENDAGQVEEALMPLWSLSTKGTSIFLVHHMRKSDGQEFVGARGSGGLPAFCDVLMEFRRKSPENIKDPHRIISANGRFNDIPLKLWAELTPAGYVSHGDPDDSQERAAVGLPWAGQLRECLEGFGETWATFEELREALQRRRQGESVRKGDLVAELKRLHDAGEIERDGEGKSASPYRYRQA